MKMRTRKFSNSGSMYFTLVELLVVIAIIAILASMLLPALNQSRDRAKAVACTNTLKHYGMQGMFYADAYADYYVGCYLPTIGWWANNRAFRTLLGGKINIPETEYRSYVFSDASLCCPKAIRALTPTAWGCTDPSLYFSYGMTPEDSASLPDGWKELGGSQKSDAYKLSRIRDASHRMAFADSQGVVVQKWATGTVKTNMAQSPTVEMNGVIFRHSNQANVLMMDGHVEAMREGEIHPDRGADNKKYWYMFYF